MNLLLAAVLLLQDKAAEESFRRLESAISNAKTIQTAYKFGGAGYGGTPYTAEGTLLLKEGNKGSSHITTREGKAGGTSILVSDGSHMFSGPGLLSQTVETPRNFGVQARLLLCTAGPAWASHSFRGKSGVSKEDLVLDSFAALPDEGKAKVLRYRVTCKSDAINLNEALVTLWYEPDSNKLLKRKIQTRWAREGEYTEIELYSEFVLDADIPDEKFKIPEERK